MSAKIKYVADVGKELSLVSFTNGTLVDSQKGNITFECFEHNSGALKSKRKKRIMVAETGSLGYVGYNFGENAPRSSALQSYYVGVLSKKTGKMKVFPSNLFTLKPYLEDSTPITNPDALNTSLSDKRDLLVSAFGGKKKRKAMEARHRYAIHGESLESGMSATMENAKVIEHQETKEAETSGAIPHQNKDAKDPDEVYDIKSIISDADYYALDEIIKEYEDVERAQLQEWKANSTHSEYLINFFPKLPKNESSRTHKLKLLAYYDILTQLLKLKYNDLRKKDPIPNISDPIKQSLLNKFTITSETGRGTSRSMGQTMKDKVIAHALVLALFLENFVIDLSNFQVDFKMSNNKLMTIANALGCYTSKKTVNQTPTIHAELKIPLFKPSTVKKTPRR